MLIISTIELYARAILPEKGLTVTKKRGDKETKVIKI